MVCKLLDIFDDGSRGVWNMTTILTNINASMSQEATRRATSSVGKSMDRLSTGIRINSAADDASGLAITNRMTSLTRGTSVAIRNVMDGISMAQVADGALEEITNSLQRLRELAVQSSSDTLNNNDRAMLNVESDQLKAEINNIASKTNFNGIKLLDGSISKLPIQSGANNGETISLSVNSAHPEVLGTSLTKKDLNKVILTFSGGHAAMGERIYVGGVAVDLPKVDIAITAEASYWNQQIAESVKEAFQQSEKYKNFNVSSLSNSLVITAEKGVSIPEISFFSTANANIKMGLIDTNSKQFQSTSYSTTLGFTAAAYPAGHVIEVAGVSITLGTYTAGADPTITSWGQKVAAEVKIALESNEKFSRFVIERYENTLLVIAPNASQLDLQGFSGFNGQNIDLTVDAPTGTVNGVNYGSNNFNNFIGVTKNTSLTFTGGELSKGGYVQIGNTKITLPTFNPATSNDVKYWNDLVAGTIKTALDNSTEFDGYFFKQVDNNLLVFAAGDRESFDFDIVNSSDSQIKMAIDEPEQNLMTTSSTLRPEQFLTNIEGLERVTRSSGKSLSSIDLLNGNSARESITTIDVAIDIISSSRAQMGAFLNRLESVSVNLSEYLLNTTNARSRIQDTDYAQETVALAKNQIISQSALAMLAQANQSAQTVLALLKT